MMIRPPLPRALAAAVALTLLAPGAGAQEPPGLVPHRAVYDLVLADASGGPRGGLESARGRIAFEFGGDACEGYTLKYRQITALQSGETGARTSDLSSTTFEAGDGTSFRFKSESRSDGGAPEVVDGDGERRPDGTVGVRLRSPKRETLALEGGVTFPTDHLKRIIAAAREGRTTLGVKVFDGSDDGQKVYDTLAIIGRRIEPGAAEPAEAAARRDELKGVPRWPVRLSYFGPGQGESTPIYIIAFDLYENGISRALRLDYGDFALTGELKTLEILPASRCDKR